MMKIQAVAVLLALVMSLQAAGKPVQTGHHYSYVVDPYHAYSYEEMLEDAEALQDMYPDLIYLDSIGQSVEGRDLILINFGNGERKIFLNGALHACEYISTTYLMVMIDRYAYAYKNGGTYAGHDIKTVLDKVTFAITPMLNPDGVNLVQNGTAALKSDAEAAKIFTGSGDWKANINGVDLNRNFDDNWYVDRPVNKPAPDGFKGYSPLSEPEAKAVEQFLNTNMCWAFISFHSKGAGLYGWEDSNAKFYPQLDSMVSRIMEAGNYMKFIDTADTDYGTFAGFARGTFLKPTLTVELCRYIPDSPYPDEDFDSCWEPAKSFCAIIAEEVLKMAPQEYLVYQNARFLHAFCDEAYAMAFAAKWANSRVLKIIGGYESLKSVSTSVVPVRINKTVTYIQAYNIGYNNYFKIRDLAAALTKTSARFEAEYDSLQGAVILTSGKEYTPVGGELIVQTTAERREAILSTANVYLDGTAFNAYAFNIGDNNYIKLRDIAAAMDISVDYDAATGTIIIDTSAGYKA